MLNMQMLSAKEIITVTANCMRIKRNKGKLNGIMGKGATKWFNFELNLEKSEDDRW